MNTVVDIHLDVQSFGQRSLKRACAHALIFAVKRMKFKKKYEIWFDTMISMFYLNK